MLLELKDVHASYGGKIKVLHGVSLGIARGEVVTLIGANGAGKSALLKVVSGLLPVEQGEVLFEGRNIAGRAPHQVASLGIVQVPEGRRIFPRLTVEENLDMGAFPLGARADLSEEREKIYRMFPILRARSRQLGGTLSGGEQQMLAIGRALMSRPKLLMLDEPSMGLAPTVVEKIFETVREINRRGVTILLVEQNAMAALELAKRGYVLETGKVTLADSCQNLLANDQVRRAYLGLSSQPSPPPLWGGA